MTSSAGQNLAIDQLEDIVGRAKGALTIEDMSPPHEDGGLAIVTFTFSTAHLEKVLNGLPIRPRERLRAFIPQNFPLTPPSLYSDHKRFKGYPHVQWGDSICLFQSRNIEWSPSDGMYGFIQRVNDWFKAAALDALDPDDAPLHPPANIPTTDKRIISRIDTPDFEGENWHWIGSAVLNKVRPKRFDIVGWAELGEAPANRLCGAVILLKKPLPIEYPDTVLNLLIEIVGQGVPLSFLVKLIKVHAIQREADEPLLVVLGAPMRRPQPGGPLKQHLAVWEIDPEIAETLRAVFTDDLDDDEAERAFKRWAVDANMSWCRVYEDRPEVTLRRDQESTSSWLFQKRILLLGCGALGSHIAEILIRAGTKQLDLVDHDSVSPGVLIRQQYDDHDIAYTKNSCLKMRLKRIYPEKEIDDHYYNLDEGILTKFPPSNYDLIIDATASRTISHIFDQELVSIPQSPPIVSIAVSARSEYGMASVRMGEYGLGPLDIARRVKMTVSDDPRLKTLETAFWPDWKKKRFFQPEPGCSEPTFVGGAAEIAYHASTLILKTLDRVQSLESFQSSVDISTLPGSASNQAITKGLIFNGQVPAAECRSGFRVVVGPGVEAGLRTAMKQNVREKSELVETGGLMFGQIDDVSQTIWVDAVTGPPPDSERSEKKFLCGVEGTKERSDYQKERSGSVSRFIGIWHTHPVSPGCPSDEDLHAMATLLHAQEKSPRHVAMLIIGNASTVPNHAYYLFRRNEFEPVIIAYHKLTGAMYGR